MNYRNHLVGTAVGLIGGSLGWLASAQAAEPPDATAQQEELAEVVVTGSNIRGVAPTGSALIAVDRAAIVDSAGVTTSAILLETPQVMNFGITESSRTGNGGSGNITRGSSINIRGISPFATLTLFDGHRMTPNGTTGAAPDPNVIPTIALERIEIVADGASAIYGSDAIAGVANLILRRKLQGAEANVHYAVANGYNERQLGAIWGTSWSGGNLTLAFENGQHSNLSGVDRDFFQSDLRAQGGADNRVTQCAPGNVVIGTTSYAIPAAGATAATLVAGTTNRCDNIKFIDIIPKQSHNGAALTFDHSFNDIVSAFAQGYWSRRDYTFIVPTPSQNLTVPNTNAFYVRPAGAVAGTSETVQYSFAPDFGPNNPRFANVGLAETYNVVGGLSFKLPADWRVEGSVGYGHDFERNNSLGINTPALTAALASSNPATALNPFGTSVNNQAVLDSLVTQVSIAPGRSISRDFAVKGDGPLFHLPGGEVRAALGAEQLYVSVLGGQITGAVSAPVGSANSAFYDRTIKSAFAELAIPIVGEANAVTGIRRIDLSLAGRREQYSDAGTNSHPKIGLNWTVVDGFTLHGSYGTSFRAPGLSSYINIATPGIFLQNYSDPTCGCVVQGAAINGKPAKVGPEKATTYSYGLDWTPSFLSGAHLSVNYFDLNYTDQIVGYLANLSILQNPVAYGAVFQRRPSDAAGSAAFTAMLQSYINEGRTISGGTAANVLATNVFVDGRSFNQGVTKAKGFDVDLGYHLQTSAAGSFNFGFAGTFFTSYLTAPTSTAPTLDVLNHINQPLKFRGRLTTAWDSGAGWKARVAVNRTGGYINDLSVPIQNVGAYTTVDGRVSYDLQDRTSISLLHNLTVALEVSNLFDKNPPFVNITTSANGGGGFDPNAANPVGRLVGLTVNKRF